MSEGKAWASAGFALGVAVSVAGNVAHTWHPSLEALAAAGITAEQWRPELGAQLVAAFFPLALLVTVEVLARVTWPSGRGWGAARFGGAGLVALVAAVVSYLHLHGLLVAYGEDAVTALLGPLAVDGLMVVCGFALLAISRVRERKSAPERGEITHPDYAPASEAQIREPLTGTDEDEKGRRIVPTPGNEKGLRIANTPGGARGARTVDARPEGVADHDSLGVLEREVRVPEVYPVAAGDEARESEGAVEELFALSVRTFADTLFAGGVPGIRAIKAELKVGQARAQEVQAYLSGLVRA